MCNGPDRKTRGDNIAARAGESLHANDRSDGVSREDRIRAHVQLCWLALLLIRVAETATGDTWCTLRYELDRIHLVTLATDHGQVTQRSVVTAGQRKILAA
nr:hypothetical protein GCM10017611_00430 [Rhodococcus wratislaviensis]